MNKVKLCVRVILLLTIVASLSCSTPVKSEEHSITIPLPIKEVHKITIDIFVLNNMKIEKKEDYYVEGFLSASDPGLWTRGCVVSVWLEAVGENRTKVAVDTAKRGSLGLGSPDVAAQLLDAIKQHAERNYKKAEVVKNLGEKNKKDEEEFLDKNKLREGVSTLPSGLQYKIITEGTGKTPAATDTVIVNYRGSLVNGTEFDSSYKRGTPIAIHVNAAIQGWTEALQLMKEGARWQLFVPSNLAYGDKGAGDIIEPNMTLIFEVELISIK